MSFENPNQRAPLVENKPDAYLDPVWFEFIATLTALVNEQRRTLKDQQTAIEDLEQRVQALETP